MFGFGGEGAQKGLLRQIIDPFPGPNEALQEALKRHLILEICFEDGRHYACL
jgi:hypothetical protein